MQEQSLFYFIGIVVLFETSGIFLLTLSQVAKFLKTNI